MWVPWRRLTWTVGRKLSWLDRRELESAKITPEPPPAYTASAAPSLDTIPMVEKHRTIFPDAAVRFTS